MLKYKAICQNCKSRLPRVILWKKHCTCPFCNTTLSLNKQSSKYAYSIILYIQMLLLLPILFINMLYVSLLLIIVDVIIVILIWPYIAVYGFTNMELLHNSSIINNNKRCKIPFRVITVVLIIMFIIGMIGGLGNIICNAKYSEDNLKALPEIRFPLGDTNSLAVDDRGNIYCTISFYSRIQVYSREGKFLTGWFVNANAKPFYIKIDSNNNIQVITEHRSQYMIFNKNGNLLSSKVLPDNKALKIVEEFKCDEVKDNAGNTYTISGLFPQVMKMISKERSLTVVSDPLYLRIFQGPFPVTVFFIIPLIIFAIINIRHNISNRY